MRKAIWKSVITAMLLTVTAGHQNAAENETRHSPLEQAVITFLAENYSVLYLDWNDREMMMYAFNTGVDGPFPPGVCRIFPTIESHSDIQVFYNRENPGLAFISLPLAHMWGHSSLSRNYLYEDGIFTFLGETNMGHRAWALGIDDAGRFVMFSSHIGDGDSLKFYYVDIQDPARQRHLFIDAANSWSEDGWEPFVDRITGREFEDWGDATEAVYNYFQGLENRRYNWSSFGVWELETQISQRARLVNAEYVNYWRARLGTGN